MKLVRKSGVLAAIDTADLDAAAAQAGRLGPSVAGIKLGLEFYMAHGAPGYRRIAATIAAQKSTLGPAPIFLDLKFHDIPNTVAGAVRSVAPLEPLILNVHASGGKTMMRAARDAAAESAEKFNLRRPKVIGVTVLTSLDDVDLRRVGQAVPARDQVLRLAELARESELDGVVCSPQEITALRERLGNDFLLVTPGIRPDWAATGDQKRVMTPAEAARAGADYLVIGRPITADEDPAGAAGRIVAEIDAA
ncbi:orotidine-5'-phosphate decarboxylase [Dongia sedimenti]|uniref:Orotidine 5'-phosphate decarboxylase n=1 Tax=Dongia sedimenti TaxID=3064282 RepID=A0ABU0YML0_9PROT|nr:orotidine-5'-phosphate decarboxylase [Rhodospirillaceae bacterium R-7]